MTPKKILSRFGKDDITEQIRKYEFLISELEQKALPGADGLYFYFKKKINELRKLKQIFVNELHSRN
ncbi:MAG: hypothetical protein ACXQS8_03460 [Candidatus Helarchaeales archaeon]